MLVLIGIGLVAGIVTAISPCVLPVLPIVLAGGASGGGRRRPLAIVAGLVTTFTLSVLVATWVLSLLGLPQDLLRNVAIALLFVVAVSLVVPRVGELLERPFDALTRRRVGSAGGGFVLGASLGFVFVPCGGPVLGTVSTLAASHRFGLSSVALTLAYAVGASLPLLLIAFGAGSAIDRSAYLRAHAAGVRRAAGVAIAVMAMAILFDVPQKLQTAIGDYTRSIQRHTEESAYARSKLARLKAPHFLKAALVGANEPNALPDFGPAPPVQGITSWLNTPHDAPLPLPKLRGKVVLVDFWTYSCINCLRTIPYLSRWYERYAPDGFVVLGVHSPEFAFEHELSNVRRAVKQLGVTYPVAIDNRYKTWDAYANQYWPAEYLVDRRGHVRKVHIGEGAYDETETAIRRLLAEPGARLPKPLRLRDRTPHGLITPETYLGYARLISHFGEDIQTDQWHDYTPATKVPPNAVSYGGRWYVAPEYGVAGPDAALFLHYVARRVYIVLGGRGRVDVRVDGRKHRPILVRGDRLYAVVRGRRITNGLLELRFSPGLRAYSFTFG